jgi:serine/threonine protein kinase
LLRSVFLRQLLNRVVALKMVRSNTSHDPEMCRRLAAEAHAASALSHPGIATVYDFVEQGESSFMVYGYVEGRTWRKELARARFTTDEILDAGAQLADALAAAHTHGIVHRDLKPENIMSVPDDYSRGRVKTLDFGLAKHLHAPLSVGEENAVQTVSIATSPGLLIGTVNYMAPEQLEGQSVDARTDLYAVGIVLYEMATETNPFLRRTPPSTIANILKQRSIAAPTRSDGPRRTRPYPAEVPVQTSRRAIPVDTRTVSGPPESSPPSRRFTGPFASPGDRVESSWSFFFAIRRKPVPPVGA